MRILYVLAAALLLSAVASYATFAICSPACPCGCQTGGTCCCGD